MEEILNQTEEQAVVPQEEVSTVPAGAETVQPTEPTVVTEPTPEAPAFDGVEVVPDAVVEPAPEAPIEAVPTETPVETTPETPVA